MKKVTISSIIREYIKQNPRMFVFYCLIILAMPLNEILLPHYFGKMINAFHKNTSVKQFVPPILFLFILVQLIVLANDLIELNLYPKMHAFIRRYVLSYILEIKSKNYSEIETGRLMSQLVRLPSSLYNFLDDWRNYVIPYLVVYYVVMIYMFTIDFWLGVMVAIVALGMTYVTVKSLYACRSASKTRDFYFNRIFEEVDDLLKNMISVLNNNTYDSEMTRLDLIQEEFRKYSFKAVWCSTKYKISCIVVFIAIMYVFAKRCIHLYKSHKINLSIVVSIILIVIYMFNTVMKHSSFFKDLVARFGILSEMMAIFNEYYVEDLAARPKNSPIVTDSCLVLRNVSFSYPNGKQVVKDINLDIKCKDAIAIVGEIGSGKSTIIKLILKYHHPNTGEIYFKGLPYSMMDEKTIRSKIGFIYQSPILFNRTILENIKYGKKGASDSDVYRLINKLGLEKHFTRYPKGLDTNAGKNGSNLSGGEKQIVWILRVLLQDPDMIMLDEPTAAMDSETTQVFFDIIMRVTKEKTVVVVTHDKEVLKYFNRVVVIKNNTIYSDTVKHERKD